MSVIASLQERKYRLLVAEDDGDMRLLLQKTLTREGFDVETARDGVQALEAVRQTETPFDVLVSDVHMPEKGAEELIPEVKLLVPDLKIIVISGYAELDLYLRLVKCGAFDFVTKPFKIPDLLEVIDRALAPAAEAG